MNKQAESQVWQRNRKKQRGRRELRLMAWVPLSLALLLAGAVSCSTVPEAGDSFVIPDSIQPSSSYTAPSAAPSIAPGNPESTAASNSPGSDDWRLLLVNPWNSLPAGYEVTVKQLSNGHAVDERCYPDLQEMMDDCRAEGLQPLLCSSYRTQDKQQSLFDNKVNSLIAQGYAEDAAREKAAESIAVPGTSEHQTGLAVDIVDINNQNLDESQESTPAQQWLMENSWQYGFILRYPSDKFGITGIEYEPWHYRYVGKEAAKEIREQGICLEEYLESIETRD